MQVIFRLLFGFGQKALFSSPGSALKDCKKMRKERMPRMDPTRKGKKPGPGLWSPPKESRTEPKQMPMATTTQNKALIRSFSLFFIPILQGAGDPHLLAAINSLTIFFTASFSSLRVLPNSSGPKKARFKDILATRSSINFRFSSKTLLKDP